jgi:hypothetical protein
MSHNFVYGELLVHHLLARIELHHDVARLYISVSIAAHIGIHINSSEVSGGQVAHEKKDHRWGAEHHLQTLKAKLVKVILDLDHFYLVR